MSLPNHIPRARRSEVGKRWAQAKAAKRIQSGVDAETMRRRALHDARGLVIREGCTYTTTGETRWQIRRSLAGRTNQFDAVANGTVVRTGGMRRIKSIFYHR